MERVKCRECAMIANTASPDFTVCQCGGRFRRVKPRTHRRKSTTFSSGQRFQWQCIEE